MVDVIVKVKRLTNSAKLPQFVTKYAVGADLFADESKIIQPKSSEIIKTGIAIELPIEYEAQIRSRSGLAAKNNVFVLNEPGTIDTDYRGEIFVTLYNASDEPFVINKGNRIAQIVVKKRYYVEFIEVDSINDTERGHKGLGSTGV